MASIDLYETLQVARDSDLATIKRSFKKLALQWHPDKNSNTPEAQDTFQQINEAYAILSDPDKRAFYDKATSFLGRGPRGGRGSAGGGASRRSSAAQDAPGPGRTASRPRENEPSEPRASHASMDSKDAPAGADGAYSRVVVRKLPVTLEELFFGFHKRLKVSRKVQDVDGNVTVSSVILTVNGQPGWRHGTRLTFDEAGDKPFGLPAQDVVIVIEEEPHARFERRGDDLLTHVQVPLFNALYGHTEHIETLDGKKVNVPVMRVAPGMLIALPGEGMPRVGGGRGALLLKYRILVPAHAEDNIRAAAAMAHGPTDWRRVLVECAACHEMYRDEENSPDACFHHPGQLVPRGPEYLRWDCCQTLEGTPGCVAGGEHTCTDAARAKARATAAYNGLMAAARAGDVYAAAWFMLDCSVHMQQAPIRTAVSHGHFLVTLLFVRDGADMAALGGPLAALEAAAMHDTRLGVRLLHAMDNDPELFSLFAAVPGAPAIAFAHGCRSGDVVLCQRLLMHARVGPSRCAVARQASLAAALLFACARVGDVACMRVLTDSGVDVNSVDPTTQRTALHYAAAAGHRDVIDHLLLSCARTTERDSDGQRPVDLAAQQGFGECVVWLETAMLEEALLSMAGLSVLRLLLDGAGAGDRAANGSGGTEAGARVLDAAHLRPCIVVLDDALRTLTQLSQGLSGSGTLGAADPDSALETYEAWNAALGANDDVFTRNQTARDAVDSLLAAGVALKAEYQEQLSMLTDA